MIPETSITFAAGTLDRAAHLRGDPQALAAMLADPAARVLAIWRGKPLIELDDEGGVKQAHWTSPTAQHLSKARSSDWTLLGLDDGAARLAVDISDLPPDGESAPQLVEGAKFIDLRSVMAELGPEDAAAAATAKGLWEWHRNHRFCAKCGEPSAVEEAGWRRGCTSCDAKHFPRTDPVVIMLVVHGDKLLLGHQEEWTDRMYSLLAGFMEPGETMEAAVRREVAEEAGVRIGRVRYLACQPWPFPSTLMIGCMAEALNEDLTIDPTELADAFWASRAEVEQALRGEAERFDASRHGAIARRLMEAWVAGEIEDWDAA